MKIRKNLSTQEDRDFWKSFNEASKKVEKWPKWKKEIVILKEYVSTRGL